MSCYWSGLLVRKGQGVEIARLDCEAPDPVRFPPRRIVRRPSSSKLLSSRPVRVSLATAALEPRVQEQEPAPTATPASKKHHASSMRSVIEFEREGANDGVNEIENETKSAREDNGVGSGPCRFEGTDVSIRSC